MLNKIRWKWTLCAVILLIFPFAFTSCGGSGSKSAGGGISGTGVDGTELYSGQITGFGSVIVNGTAVNTDTAQFTFDGNQNATQSNLAIGMKVTIEAVNKTSTTVVYESEAAGPLDMVNPGDKKLEVMMQTVYVDSLIAATTFKGVGGIADLQSHINEDVLVSGFFDADGDIYAAFIELVTTPLLSYRLKGSVESLESGKKTFKLSQLVVDYSGAQDPGIQDGSFVKIEGSLATVSGNLTLIASKLEIDTPAPPSNPGWEMDIEGIITGPGLVIADPADFELNGLRVQTGAGTTYTNGTAADIAINKRVEVEGTVDSNGILIAAKVEFRVR